MRSQGVPLGITSETARSVLRTGFRRQPVKEEKILKLRFIQRYVLTYIKSFGTDEDTIAWNNFFTQYIPEVPVGDHNSVPQHDTYLHKLFNEYGGDPRRKCREHFKPRETISKYTEPMVFPEAAWDQLARDTAAAYAVSMDTSNSLLKCKGDLKRVPRKRKRKALKDSSGDKELLDDKSAKSGPTGEVRVKVILLYIIMLLLVIIFYFKAKNTPRKRGRPRKVKFADEEDEVSAFSDSTEATSYAPSLKSNCDSDLESDFPFCDDNSSACSSIQSDYSTTDLAELPSTMKHRDIGASYQSKIGRKFKDIENGKVYRVISLCKYLDDDVLADPTKKLLVDKLCFKYIEDDILLTDDEFDVEDVEISLCSEMMVSSDECWVEWL